MTKPTVATLALSLVAGLAGGALGTYGVLHSQPAPPAGVAPGQDREAVSPARVQVLAPTKPDGVTQLVEQVRVGVVNIDTEAQREAPPDAGGFVFGEAAPAPQRRVLKGVGSGFVLNAKGLIATNYHVVEGTNKLTVTFYDGKRYTGEVVGTDPATDLALVRIRADGLARLPLASPSSLKVGQFVVALGSPLGLQQTVTMGVLSALNRDIGVDSRVGFLQTDAPINPGNSGGPLMNLKGEVIGINTAIAASAQGIGFAIPVDTLQSILPQLEASVRTDRAWHGVRVANLPVERSQMAYPADQGVLVTGVEQGSPAARAGGIAPGDVLLRINGQPLADCGSLMRVVAPLSVGNTVTLSLAHRGQPKTVTLTLVALPARGAR